MGRVRYGQAGYCGQSRSIRAAEAEAEGQLPITRAVRALARQAGVTQARAREALAAVGPAAWHHTGRYARRTDYYDLAAARRWMALKPLADRLRRDGILARLDEAVESVAGAETSHADRTRAVDAALADLAADAGCHADDLATIYWHDYSGE